jgi:hypothetical protein
MRVFNESMFIAYSDEDGNQTGTCLPAKHHDLKLVFHDDSTIAPNWRASCPVEGGCTKLFDERDGIEDCWVDTWVTEGYAVGGEMELTFNAEWEHQDDYLQGFVTGIKKIEIPE